MSRFKNIRNKINKNSSMSVDEKLAALDKELEKTGMSNVSEMMTTDNVLSSSEYVPPQERIVSDVPNSSGIGGEGFTQSSAGSGTEGDAPNHSSISDLYNSDVGHPIYKSTSYNGVSSYGIVIGPSFGAGTSYGIIEGGNTYRQVLGGHLAGGTRGPGNYQAIYDSYIQTNETSPGFYSDEQIASALENWQLAIQVNAILTEIGYDNAKFQITWKAWRRPILFEDLSSYPSYNHPTKGLIYLVPFSFLGLTNRYTSQEPRPATTTNPQRRGLEDDPIFPGPIATLFGLGQRAFDWLRGKAKKEKDYEINRKKNRPKPVGSEPEPDPTKPEPDPTKPEPDPTKPDTEKDYEKNRKNNRPEVTGEVGKDFANEVKEVAGKSLKDLSNFWKDVVNTAKTVKSTVDAIPTSGNALVGWAKNNNPDHPDYRKNDPRSPNYEGPLEAKTSSKWKNDVGKQLKKSLPDKSDYEFDGQEGPTWEERLKNSKDGEVTLTDWEIEHLSNKMSPGVNGDMRFHTLFNSLPPSVTEVSINSEGEIDIESNYRFTDRDDVSSGGILMKNWVSGIAERDKTGDTFPFLDKKNGKPIGDVHDINLKLKLNMNGGNKSNWPRKELQTESYITEGVGLGLYEPEAMNVDLADIRKGVMPEYPKKPPAEMIDGYHQDSRIRPKNIKDEEPYLKIDRTDLIRSHRLKKSEADEMMNTINMINDHIKAHPEDLIHAQQRYPVDDPRLAELNWKMDQMLEAGEEYLDSNFKENKKLFKRATEHTLKNIKLTDPKYVQQKYDELRGTIKPKKTKLVGRLGKHLNKYESKSLFKHVNSKDFKKISERKLEKKKFLEKQEQKRLDYINDINGEMDEFRSDWRNELKEQPAFKAVPIDTGKMTSSQSFAVFPNFPGSSDTGIRLDLDGGLGRDNSLANTDTGLGDPNFTGIFQFPTEGGGFVPAISFKAGGEINSAQISYGDFPLSGYAMPLGGKMSRSINQKKSEEINKELESSEEFTKKIEADALMKARVDSNIMTGNNLQDITTSFENVKVPFDQGKFSSYMRTNIEQFQTLGAYEAEIEVLENKIRKTEEARNKNYAAKMAEFEKQIKQIKEKQRKIPVDPKYPKTKISQAQFDALLKEISPADYIEGKEILKNNFLGQLEKQEKELNKKFDSLKKQYPQFNGDPERILGKWNGSVQIPIFDSDNNEIKPPEAAIGKQLEMIRLKKNIFNRMIYDSFDPSSVTYTMPPTVSDTSEPSPKQMKSSGADLETMADIEKFAPEIIQQEINLNDVKSLEDLPQNKVLETIAKLGRFQTGGLSLPFDLTIKYAMGDYTPVTKSPGAVFDNVTLTAIENAHIKYPGRNSVSPDNYVNMPSRFAQAAFQHFDYEVTPKGIRVKDDFNFKDPNKGGSTSIGAFAALDDYLPDKIKAQTIATNLVKIGDKRAKMLGYDPRDDKFGIPINYLIPYRRLSQKQKKLFYPERFRNENKRGSAFNKIKKIRNK